MAIELPLVIRKPSFERTATARILGSLFSARAVSAEMDSRDFLSDFARALRISGCMAIRELKDFSFSR